MSRRYGILILFILALVITSLPGCSWNGLDGLSKNEAGTSEAESSPPGIFYADSSPVYNNGICSVLISDKNMVHEFSPLSAEWNIVDSWLIGKIDRLYWIAVRGGTYHSNVDGWKINRTSDNSLLSDESATAWAVIDKSRHADTGDFVNEGPGWIRLRRSRISEDVPFSYRDILLYQDGENAYLALEQNEDSSQWYLLKIWGYGDWLKKETDLFFQILSCGSISDNPGNIDLISVCWSHNVQAFRSDHPAWSIAVSWPVYTMEQFFRLAQNSSLRITSETKSIDRYFDRILIDSEVSEDYSVTENTDLWIRIKTAAAPLDEAPPYKDMLLYQEGNDAILAYQMAVDPDSWHFYRIPDYGEWLEKDMDLLARYLAF